MCDENCICVVCVDKARAELRELMTSRTQKVRSYLDKQSEDRAKQQREMSELGILHNDPWSDF